jgi:polyribonucleotide nucleotidyltransferase
VFFSVVSASSIKLYESKGENEMAKTFTMDLAGRPLVAEVGRVAAQANGAVLLHYGETVVLSTATASEKPRDGIDFFPLSVEYEEKMYAVGKIPGGYMKREGKASENAVLTDRVIDRPMRPLFPKDYRNDVTLNNLVLSVDPDCSPELTAMIGSAMATAISDIPFDGPTASTQIGLINGEFIVNPTREQEKVSELALTVASTKEKVIMIEAGAKEVKEDIMLQAIFKAHEINQQIIEFTETIVAECGKEKHEYEHFEVPADMYEDMVAFITPEAMEEAVFTDDKQTRDANISEIKAQLEEHYAENEEWLGFIDEAVYKFQKLTVRKMILKDHKRPDGRGIKDIRPLSAEIDCIPRVHGCGLFKRGQTQVMTMTTLGSLSESQRLDGLDYEEKTKRYMHHYNFPSYSVGETRPSRGPGRREIGHGALAERALVPVLPSEEEFPYAIRTVSEVLESNGSTSQGSICASSLSLMAAGVPIKAPVAGISVGLVTGETDNDYIVLTDIQGLEDFFGDMDFKVAGTEKGITAIQMDIKIHGLTDQIIVEAIERTREARMQILNDVMNPVISEPRKEVGQYAPKIRQMQVNPDKISEIIGKQGKTINAIIDETGVKIDISEDGRVDILSSDTAMIEKAMKMIRMIVEPLEVGKTYEGTVVRIMNFGAFVQLSANKDGMIHISKLSKQRVEKVEDVVNIGDKVKVEVIKIDEMHRINLKLVEKIDE